MNNHFTKTLICTAIFAALIGCDNKETAQKIIASETSPKTKVASPEIATPEQHYQTYCGSCHDGPVPKAPHRIMFGMLGPENILTSMTSGVMKSQAVALSESEKIQLAEHLGDGKLASTPNNPIVMCDQTIENKIGTASITGWGIDDANTRFINNQTASLSLNDIPKLKLKWSFAYPNATRARSQPTIHQDLIYVGSQTGSVYALSLESGCAKWAFNAEAEVRSAISIQVENNKAENLFFGDFNGNVYSINAESAELNWKMQLDDHPDLTITGSPKLYQGVLYVPMSSREWATAADPAYACCTFRGGVAAISAKDGTRLWTSHTVETPIDTGEKNATGVARYAPSGAPVWNSPTIDVKRNLLYVGSGENYSSPASGGSDAVHAINLDTGKVTWVHQASSGDAWNMACFVGGGTNCPAENGPDLDIGASIIVSTLENGKDIILVGQKSGDVFALDPDNEGALLWKRKLGLGGFDGGVHWGMAVNSDTLYAPIADVDYGLGPVDQLNPGLYSLNANNGETRWHTPTTRDCEPNDKPGCNPGLSAAVTAIPGVIFAGSLDGKLMAFNEQTGEIIWEFKTDIEFDTISGEKAHGGSIESDGPVIFDGHVLVNSGYSFGGKMPGNALLVFSVDGN